VKTDQLCQSLPSARAVFGWNILRRKPAVASTQSIAIKNDQVWSASLAAGSILRCMRGICWVTQRGQLQDVILCPGEEIMLDKSTFIVISALRQKNENAMAKIQIIPSS